MGRSARHQRESSAGEADTVHGDTGGAATMELHDGEATEHTRRAQRAALIDFDDATDFDFASRGLLAQLPNGEVSEGGRTIWSAANRDFVTGEAPPTVHPGLWRQAKLNRHHGLFQVAENCWQVRGYDISNITLMAGERGWLVIDPLTTAETARAALALANATLGERPVTAVIYTHSHVDHFGGVLGVTTAEDVARGAVRIVAPEGFLAEAVSENSHAGPIMFRRAMYQFGPILPHSPTGQVDTGLGQAMPLGSSSLIAPTDEIAETGSELTLDGIRVVFQNTPDAEAPAEMCFYFPDLRLLCLAENCTHTLHNLYPIRGAKTRDALAWSKYIHEALRLWGDRTDVAFASHHWPRFGGDGVRAFLELQRDVYRWLHDQTLRLANHGRTPDEIAAALTLPDCFGSQSHLQGYYGTVSHNARAVYTRYLGFYDGNPAHLHPLPARDAAPRYVALMGGAEAVVDAAEAAYQDGDYRWVVQLLDHVVAADPGNQAARALSGAAMEQLGFQAESATWRNAYLTGAFELRHGSLDLGRMTFPPLGLAMTTEQLADSLAVRFCPARFDQRMTMRWTFTDLDESIIIGVANAALHHHPAPEKPSSSIDADVTLDRAAFVQLLDDPARLPELVGRGAVVVSGAGAGLVTDFIAALDTFAMPRIIEPNPGPLDPGAPL